MHFLIFYLQFAFVGLGIIFLASSLFPMRSLITELPRGPLRKKWKILTLLIFFFILGYFLFAYSFWYKQEATYGSSLAISFMLLCGGVFAFLVGRLAFQTIYDVRQLTLIQDESITDHLMGIKNRRYFDQRIVEEVALSSRYKLPLSIIILDVDRFKNINDVYGHKVGDEVLKNMAMVILSTVRDTDIVARYGGEEVVIIAPNSGKKEAEGLAERLRATIEKSVATIIPTTQEVVQVTVSMGICSMSHMVTDKDALIEEADKALYLAKKQGRNRVVCSKW